MSEALLPAFTIARLPEIRFGAGRLAELPDLVAGYGERVLLVTGASSLTQGGYWEPLVAGLAARGICWRQVTIAGEPSPAMVDRAVAGYRAWRPAVVVGIGGGSVLDGAKAIAGLLPGGASVLDHLEVVGRGIPYHGPSLPLVAVPTTAGTGSEATKNAVLSEHGQHGYKRSFRHDLLMARVAIIDPELLHSLPHSLMAAQGMDAFTQLLESYLSTAANPFTDALNLSGLEAFQRGFFAALEGDGEGCAWLAYAALLSGIGLAHTGLGVVHGLASPLGALFPIPHGVVCGTLVAAATALNIRALEARLPKDRALLRYAEVGRLLTGCTGDDVHARAALVERLTAWQQQLAIPRLGEYGMTHAEIPAVVAQSRGSSMRTNPLPLHDAELAALLAERL